MIVVDKNDPRYVSLTHNKWKQMLPSITEESALHCEDLHLEFVNGKKEEVEALKEINEYLIGKGLINGNTST